MSGAWLISLFSLPCLLAGALTMRSRTQDWWAPAAAFPALWCLLVALPLLLAPEYRLWAPGVWILTLMVLLFALGAMLGQRLAGAVPPRQGGRPAMAFRPGRLKLAIVLSAFLGLFAIQVLLWEAGKTWPQLTEVTTWVEMGAKFSIARYDEGYQEPMGARIGSIGLYFGSLVGGVLAGGVPRTRGKWIFALLPLFLTVLYSAIMTTRAGILFSASMWVASFLATKVARGDRGTSVFSVRRIVLCLGLGGAFFLLVLMLQLSRGGAEDLSGMNDTAGHTKVWFCGHLSGFSKWLEIDIFREKALDWGQKTIGGPLQLLGLGKRDQGIYSDFVLLTSTERTNIYTAFRGLIEDVGLSGSLLLIGALGFLAGRVYVRVRQGSLLAVPLLAVFYANLLWTPIVSMLNYNTLVIAFVLLLACFPWLAFKDKGHPFREHL